MNIKATREEINECLTRAIERVLRENIELVGTDDETDDDIELPEENPDDDADVVVDDDYSYHDENFGIANPDDDDTANSELGDDEDDEDSYLNGKNQSKIIWTMLTPLTLSQISTLQRQTLSLNLRICSDLRQKTCTQEL